MLACGVLTLQACTNVTSATTTAAHSQEIPLYTNFRDIPGVTAEEEEAIEALQKEYADTGFTYGMFESTETYLRPDGSIGGYSSLFCDWMSELFGITFTPRMYDWNELYSGLLDGSIDFSGELTPMPERERDFYMTRTFTERAIVAYRQADSRSLAEIARERPLRFIFLGGSSTTDPVLASSQYPIEPLYANSMVEVAEMMLSDEPADAFIAEEHGQETMAEGVYAERIFPVVYSPSSFCTGQERLAPIVCVLDKYLAQGGLERLLELYNQGSEQYAKDRLYSQLTEEERDYIAVHSSEGAPIRLIAEDDNYPICFYNENEQQWQGIAISVLEEICEYTGLTYEVANNPGESWSSYLDSLQSGEADIISELLYSEERANNYIWADEPYEEDYFALISLVETEDIEINQILYSRVGVVEGSAYEDFFRKWFSDHPQLVECADTTEALQMLKDHEVDFIMASRNMLLNASNYLEDPSFKSNLIFQYSYGSYFGFPKSGETLCGIVSKAQMFVDTVSITERWTERFFDYRDKLMRQQVVYLSILSILSVVVIVLLIVQFQRKRRDNAELERIVYERTAELEVQTEAAKVAATAKGDFLSRMSHEIRTPLNAVMGMAQIAKRSAERESPKTVEAIDEMLRASEHLLGILNDVLDMSKIEAGKMALHLRPFGFMAAMDDVSNIIEGRCVQKGVRYRSAIEVPETLVVVGDALHLRQILINLLGNSVKFTEVGGEVELAARVSEQTEDSVTLAFKVTDSGIGMTEEQVQQLFKPFEQTDDTVASRFGGTGLGLAISQNLVQAMGGMITVDSIKGAGSAFSFTLTLSKADTADSAADEAAGALPSALAGSIDWSGKRILMVEDIEVNRLIVRELLADTGLEIEEAEDGQRACEMFSDSEPGYFDLILMDVQMPRLDGHSATRCIRGMSREDAKEIPIIAMTANAYSEDIDKAREAGMSAHIAKPINMEKLLETLAAYLDS
jgi:signal transduction histidine kinase